MSFLFPAFLVGFLALAIPIALHLWRRNVAPRVPFSDIRFLKRAPVTQRHRRRLRELLLLALRLAALALLVLAFARPFFDSSGMLDRPATVVALDRSFSMGAPGLFDRARAAAASSLVDAPSDHAVGLVTFDHRAVVAHDLSLDRGAVVAAVELVEVGAGSTGFAAGLGLAAEVIGSRAGRLVVVTDLQESGWDAETRVAVPATVEVGVIAVEADPVNLAVTAVQRSPGALAAVVDNAGRERPTTVSVSVDGRLLAQTEIVAPSGSTEVRFDVSPPPRGTLRVSVDDPGGIPADDDRYVLLDAPPPTAVAVVTNGGRSGADAFYLERALQAGGEADFTVTSVSADALSTRDLSEFEVVTLIGTQGLDRPGREQLAAFASSGGGLFVAAGPSLDPELVGDLLGESRRLWIETDDGSQDTRFTITDARHPLLRAFGGFVDTLSQVRVRRAVRIVETEGSHPIARFEDGQAALVEYDVGEGRALVFASDVNNEWNDFPRRPSFVPFVHELIRYLVAEREVPRELLVAELPTDSLASPGLVVLGDSGREVVVNVDPRESNPKVSDSETFLGRVDTHAAPTDGSRQTPPSLAAREADQGYWWYALLAMVTVLVAEAWLGRTLV